MSSELHDQIAEIIREQIAPLCDEGCKYTVVVRNADDDRTVVSNDPEVSQIFEDMSEDPEVTYEGAVLAPGGPSVH